MLWLENTWFSQTPLLSIAQYHRKRDWVRVSGDAAQDEQIVTVKTGV
jgi:hypothetical protein